MIRGTTPTFTLTVDDESLDLTGALNVYATFKQGSTIIEKTGEDLVVTAQQVQVYLSQEETLRFLTGTLQIQLNWTYVDGRRACTDIAEINVGANLSSKVLA